MYIDSETLGSGVGKPLYTGTSRAQTCQTGEHSKTGIITASKLLIYSQNLFQEGKAPLVYRIRQDYLGAAEYGLAICIAMIRHLW